MAYLFEDKLRQRVETFIQNLRRAGISAEILPTSFRDYSVKVSVLKAGQPYGNVVLYYSPKKDSFKPEYGELKNKSILHELDVAWYGRDDDQNLPDQWDETGYQVYVDGSYMDGKTGYGVVILENGRVLKELSGSVQSSDSTPAQNSRQVAGELLAVQEAVKWCQDNQIKQVVVFYDYEGIAQWATGSWKTNLPLTQAYANFIRECGLDIEWRKVKSHIGDRWNERADTLARQGAQLIKAVTPATVDLITEVKEVSTLFVEFLKPKGIRALVSDHVYNNQYVRIQLYEENREIGQCDLYNTKKYPLNPRWYLIDQTWQVYLEALWKEFRGEQPGGVLSPKSQSSPLLETEYYYSILKPYADCSFDFIDLARAIEEVQRQIPHVNFNLKLDEVRFDFKQLEAIYQQLRSHFNVE